MTEGDIVLAALQQADGTYKKRPVLILRIMPRFNDFLICGISTQLHQFITEFDEMIIPDLTNRLQQSSIIRLGFLGVEPQRNIQGKIGSISLDLHTELLNRLAKYLIE
jgi:mRNA interferase MazF